MTYITALSIIRHRSVFTHDTTVFANPAGSLDDFLEKTYDSFGLQYPKFYKMDRLSKLGFLACEVLLREVPVGHYAPAAVGLVLSNAHASLDTDVRYSEALKAAPSPGLFVYTLPNIVAGEICIRHKKNGENAFFITDHFDAALLSGYTDQLLLHGAAEACIGGWVEVMGEHHDVFLYLAEKEKRGLALEHTAEQLTKLYQLNYGTVDGRSKKTDH